MKKGGMIFGVVFSLLIVTSFVSAFGADSYYFTSDFNCADYGIQCGPTILNNGSNFVKSCGVCSSGAYCYLGKCINLNALGPCERPTSVDTNCENALSLSDFYAYPGQPLSERLAQYEQVCNNMGCNYNSQTQKCTGTLPSCSYFMNKECTQADDENKQSKFNEETGICTTTLKVFWSNEQECVNELKGTWDISDASCTYTQAGDLTCLARDDKWGSYYCRLRNVEDYTPNILIYRDSSFPVILLGGSNAIYLNNKDLENIKNGETVAVDIELENSGLPANTPITISEVSGTAGNIIHIQQEQLSIDVEGKVKTKLLISDELLSLLDYKGYSDIKVTVDSVNHVPMNNFGSGFAIITKTGECTGTAKTCNSYSEEVCLEIAHFSLGSCNWDYGTNTCKGGEGISCNTFDIKESCQSVGCKWIANNIFERFIDWIKGIFGR